MPAAGLLPWHENDQRIGYRPVEDRVVLSFSPAA
jgi:hypothetical protein